MRRYFYTIAIIVVGFIAYLLGTTQATTVIEVREVEKVVETIPDSYISLEQCIPLEDIACCYRNDLGYLCMELKDIQYQLDNAHNNAYMDVLEGLEGHYRELLQ